MAAGGDYAGALALYQQALAGFQAANPMAAEPLTLFTRKMDAVSAQMSSLGSVTSVTPGSTDPVFAPDSIVDAYGSGLANTTVSASGSLSTALGGTTVTITDSKGTSVLAPLFYVSPAQVNYAAPASLALGQATVTVKSGDSSTRNGTGTIVDVQPGVFTFNAAGLVAGSIVRATDTRQVLQNVYAVDGAGNVVAAPVAVSKDQVYMVFYATGIRRALAEPGDGFHRWCQRAGGLFRHARFLHRTRSVLCTSKSITGMVQRGVLMEAAAVLFWRDSHFSDPPWSRLVGSILFAPVEIAGGPEARQGRLGHRVGNLCWHRCFCNLPVRTKNPPRHEEGV